MILVLDLDGVVQTGHAEGGRWDKHLERDLGIRSKDLQRLFFKPHWPAIMLGRRDLHDALEECWPSLKCSTTPRQFVEYWFATDCTWDKAVLSAVADWRASGQKCVLATNQEHHRARYLWNERGLSQHFHEMYYSADLGVQKPDAAFFRQVENRLGRKQEESIIFLDDAPINVEAALQCGWKASLYRGVDDLTRAIETCGD
jgi:putative hydrolase of the HAD superfamily